MPSINVGIRVRLRSVLDLTVAGALPESIGSLMAEDWRAVMERGEEATTQALGRAAFAVGLEGLLVPSKPDPNGMNLLVFPERLSGKSSVEVLNAGELDKLGRSV